MESHYGRKNRNRSPYRVLVASRVVVFSGGDPLDSSICRPQLRQETRCLSS